MSIVTAQRKTGTKTGAFFTVYCAFCQFKYVTEC